MSKNILISNVQWYENWNDTLPTNFEIPEESCMASPELYALQKLGRCVKKYDGMDSQNFVQKKLSVSGYHIELQRRIVKIDVTANQALENALKDCRTYKGKIEIGHDNDKKICSC